MQLRGAGEGGAPSCSLMFPVFRGPPLTFCTGPSGLQRDDHLPGALGTPPAPFLCTRTTYSLSSEPVSPEYCSLFAQINPLPRPQTPPPAVSPHWPHCKVNVTVTHENGAHDCQDPSSRAVRTRPPTKRREAAATVQLERGPAEGGALPAPSGDGAQPSPGSRQPPSLPLTSQWRPSPFSSSGTVLDAGGERPSGTCLGPSALQWGRDSDTIRRTLGRHTEKRLGNYKSPAEG